MGTGERDTVENGMNRKVAAQARCAGGARGEQPVISGDYVRRSDDGAHARREAGGAGRAVCRKKTIGHARQRVHEFNRRKEHGKSEDPYQAQGL